MTTTTASPIEIPCHEAKGLIEHTGGVLIDVREPFEHAGERIAGAENIPLDRLDPGALAARFGDRRVIFHCRTGKRAADAASRYLAAGGVCGSLAGGIEGWKASGLSTERAPGAPRLDVMRQVQLIAGGLVLAGVILGVAVSPWFLVLSGFVGGGLMFAGATGWCGMAKLLAVMPWNKVHKAAGASCCGSTC